MSAITTVESIAELLVIQNPVDGQTVYVKSYHAGLGKGGGGFEYISTKVTGSNGITNFNGWIRLNFQMITPEMAGAKGDGVNDDTDAIQQAINFSKSIQFLSGTYKITKSLVLTADIFNIKGVKGETIIMGAGGADIYGYFLINKMFVSDFGVIEGITFDSEDSTKKRIAIYTTGYNYLMHWKITECNFNGRLTGGIIGNLIACHIYRCYFGVYLAGNGNNLIAIQSYGTDAENADQQVTSNINIIEQCEFSNCGSPTAIVEFSTGYKLVFRDCIFEQLTPTAAIVLLSGIEYPVFEGCWFENAQGTSGSGKSVIWTRKTATDLSCEVLTVNECYFHTYNVVPDGLINMSDTIRKVVDFSKNLMVSLKSNIIVGGNNIATFINSYGNTATVGNGGNAIGLQYNSPAKFDLGIDAETLNTKELTFISGGSTNPNALDDYQEGTWIPTSISEALTQNSVARYTKIGRVVHIQLDVTWSVNTDTTHAKLQNLPFVSAITSGASIGFTNYVGTIYAFILGSEITLLAPDKNLANADFSGKRIVLQATYTV